MPEELDLSVEERVAMDAANDERARSPEARSRVAARKAAYDQRMKEATCPLPTRARPEKDEGESATPSL